MSHYEFEVTDEHLKLLQGMQVDWNYEYFSAPQINPEAPYGSHDCLPDMANLLGDIPILTEGNDPFFTPAQCAYLKLLHRETETALQILLQDLRIETGTYVYSVETNRWYKDVLPS